MDGWEERFPGEDKFFVRKYTLPTNPDGTPDISVILKALDLREQQAEEMHAIYRANPMSATTFARLADAGLLESLSHLASEGTLPIRCCLGNDTELARAEASFAGAERFVLDPSALATLFFSDQYEQLHLLTGKVVMCASALDEYRELRRKFSNSARGFIGKFKGQYILREDDPAERQRQERRLDAFLAKVGSLVTLVTGESLAARPAADRDDLIRLFGQPTAEAMAEAAATKAVLWSDDLAVAEWGREYTGIAHRVWSQVVFRQTAPAEVLTELTLFLIQWRYFFTRVDPGVVLAACRAATWNPDSPVMKRVAEWLGQPELIHDGAIRLCLLSLPLVWESGTELERKQGVTKLLTQAIRRRVDGRRGVAVIQAGLDAVFGKDNLAKAQCRAAIAQMLNAERTPDEIASAKAGWAKVLPWVRRRLGMSGQADGAGHGHGKANNGPPTRGVTSGNKRKKKPR